MKKAKTEDKNGFQVLWGQNIGIIGMNIQPGSNQMKSGIKFQKTNWLVHRMISPTLSTPGLWGFWLFKN
jgi:hypothetical protein